MSKGGGGGGDSTSTVQLDPKSRQYIEERLRPAAEGARDVALNAPQDFFSGPHQISEDASSFLKNLQTGQLGGLFSGANQAIGNLGFASQQGLGGIDQFFNPYQQQVVAGVQADFDRQRSLADQAAAQQATAAGAFGGDREAILRAEALNNVNRNETAALAAIRSQGFNNAANQFLSQQQLAGQLGLGGLGAAAKGIGLGGSLAGQQFGFGEIFRGIQNQRAQEDLFRQQQGLGFLGQGVGGFGQTQNTSYSGGGSNLFGNVAGGALAGSSFGVPGAIIGGGLGLLGSIF